MELNFRDLRADEVECRVSTCSAKGVSLLLYKDARCDMNILDEAVGPMNWQREHTRDNANCIVSIWDGEKQQWVCKEDVGTESNTEAVKGLASDSFKRACFNWGVGRELYTAPFVWVPAGDVTIQEGKNGKPTTYDRFSVTDLKIENKKIVGLTIYNETLKKECYSFGKNRRKPKVQDGTQKQLPTQFLSSSQAAKEAAKNKTWEEYHLQEIAAVAKGTMCPSPREQLRDFVKEHGLDQNRIIKDCMLTMNSTDAEWFAALIYAQSLVQAQGGN